MRGSRIRRVIYCAASAASLVASLEASGSSFTWNKTTGGTWNVAANWTPSGPPTGNDDVLFNLNASYTVTLPANEGANLFTVGSLSVGSVTLNASGHSLAVNTARLLGGTVNFNGGTLTDPNVANTIEVSDRLNIGTASAISTAGILTIGNTFAGTLNCTAGTLNVGISFSPDSLIGAGAEGTLVLDSASVATFGNNAQIGETLGASRGEIDLFHASSLTAHSLSIGVQSNTPNSPSSLQIGSGSTSGGSVTQLGASTMSIGGASLDENDDLLGQLAVTNGTFTTGTGSILVNTGGGIFVSNSGVLNVNGNLTTTGHVQNIGLISGPAATIQANNISLGTQGVGLDTVVVAAPSLENFGTISAGTLIVGAPASSTGWAAMLTTTRSSFGTTIVGGAGAGTLQIGAVDNLLLHSSFGDGSFGTGSLLVAQSAGSSGTVLVIGSLSIGSATIGGLGDATFNSDGDGSVTVAGPIVLADSASSHALLLVADVNGSGQFPSITFSSAALVAPAQQMIVGRGGAATLLIGEASAGTVNTVSIGTLQIGSMATGVGTVILTSGTLTASAIHIGNPGAGAGTYIMNGGTLSGGSIDITSDGTFIYNAGTISGTISANGGTLLLAGALPSAAITLNYASNSNIFLNGNPITKLSGSGFGLFAGTGTLINSATLSGDGTLLTGQTLVNNGTFSSIGGDLVVTAGATLNNGSTGLLRNAPASNFRIQTNSFTNLGNLEVNADGAIELVTDLSIATSHKIIFKGGLLTNGGQLTIANGGSLSGFGQIDSNLINHGSTTFAGSMLVLGNLSNDGVITARDATSIVYGSVSNTGSIVVQNGTIVFESALSPAPATTGGLDGAGVVTVNPDGRVLASYIRQNALAIAGASLDPAIATIRTRDAGGDISRLSTVGITSGKFDLADTALIADAMSPSAIRALLVTGFNAGNWQGLGLTSSTAAAVTADQTSIHKTALGFAQASALGISSFLGQSVGPSSTLVRYTFAGDENLDGTVNTSDFTALAAHFNSSTTLWSDGDFNYDGKVNALDFNAIATNFGQTLPADPALASLIPEPNSIVLLSICAHGWFFRRRSKVR